MDDSPKPKHPEIIVFASYSGPPKYPLRVSLLGEMVSSALVNIDLLTRALFDLFIILGPKNNVMKTFFVTWMS